MSKLLKSVVFMATMAGFGQLAFAGGDADSGAELVAVCAACHGADGNSASSAFPKIAGLGEKYLFTQLKAIRNMNGENTKAPSRPIPMMTGLLDGMSDQDLQDMAAFYTSKTMQITGSKKAEVQLNSGKKVDSLALGQKLYRAGNAESGVPSCTGCHSPKGLGNGPAGFPRLSGQYAEYITKQLKDYRAGNRNTDGETMIMRGVAKGLSDSEIEALANYIAGLN